VPTAIVQPTHRIAWIKANLRYVDDDYPIRFRYDAIGRPAHTLRKGRRYIRVMETNILVSHIVWFLCVGVWPTLTIDHRDENKINDRIGNLQELSHKANIYRHYGTNLNHP
jgi:hypothetical protein